MKLSAYARKIGVSYRTAFRWFHAGKLPGYQMHTGTIIITDAPPEAAVTVTDQKVATIGVANRTRVSAAENKSNPSTGSGQALEGQAKRLTDYCAAKGYRVALVVKEIGSGVNDTRPKLMKLMTDPSVTLIVVEHKDRLTRFGFNYLDKLLTMQGRRIEVIRPSGVAENGKEDLVQDFVSIVTSFCARLAERGQRRSKRKTERIMAELQAEEADDKESHATPDKTRSASSKRKAQA